MFCTFIAYTTACC